jgi:ATP-dependent Clp protease adaptor protein ClpS
MKNIRIADPAEKILDDLQKQKQWSIILYNDPVNSFDQVISLLMLFCNHEWLQAEQCATIVHHKGKYPIKHGERDEMVEIASKLGSHGLTVEVE